MQDLDDTQVKFREFHFKIPCDRTDLIAMADLIAKKAKEFEKEAINTQDKDAEISKILSFAGSQSGSFKDLSVEEMRIRKALKI